jgi:hypothetical protein
MAERATMSLKTENRIIRLMDGAAIVAIATAALFGTGVIG